MNTPLVDRRSLRGYHGLILASRYNGTHKKLLMVQIEIKGNGVFLWYGVIHYANSGRQIAFQSESLDVAIQRFNETEPREATNDKSIVLEGIG